MTDTRLVSAIRAATAAMRSAAIDLRLEQARDRARSLLRTRVLHALGLLSLTA
jgi:hypothetical protein